MMRFLVYAFTLLLSCVAAADVRVTINQQAYDFAHQPRLDEVLRPVAYQQPWYWPAARLYRLNSSKFSELRNDVVSKLKFIQADSDQDQATVIAALIEQINSWQLAERILINLDYELAQTRMERNPRFDSGHYQLNLVARPSTLSLFGLLKQPVELELNSQQCLHEYVHQAIADLKNEDYVYLIKPNGQSQKIAIAYWNAGCVDVMPGSQIFIPFAESQFFSDMAKLNAQIIELAKHRLM